ncbi:MAG: beta-propeller domain-containing protein [Candidatus Saccharibacteria bacterium]|nr:beta-propeller domain-containing protein [Rhodoferax sp.]
MITLARKQAPGVRSFRIWLCTLLLMAVSAHAGPFQLADVQPAGISASLSLQTTLTLDGDHVGKSIQVFVVAQVPDAGSGKWYARSAKEWLAVDAETIPAFQTHAVAEATSRIDLSQNEDTRGLTGTRLFVGYGVAAAGVESTFAEMLRSRRYRLVYTFPAEASAADWSLQPATEATLKTHFREVLGVTGRAYLSTPWAMDFVSLMTTATTSATPSAAVAVSGTTLQEAGVDEADRVKSDGLYVFSLAAPDVKSPGSAVLVRHALQSAGTTPALAEVDRLAIGFSKDIEATGLYQDATGQQLAVLGESTGRSAIYDAWFAPQAWTQNATELVLVDTSSTSRMQTKRKLRINAALVGSRRLGNTLYLVVRSTAQLPGLDPWWPQDKTVANQSLLDAMQVSAVLPTLSVDSGAALPLVNASQCFTQPGNVARSPDVISLVAIDLAATSHRHAARCFTGGTEAFYMSEQSLYLATTRTPYTYSSRFPVYAAQSSTDVHKFALDGLEMTYRGSGNVPGHLGFDQNRKSFRMGEHQGALRVITQSTTWWGGWGVVPASSTGAVESPGRLSILQESKGTLAMVGELPNAKRPAPLGKPGEQLYASRFLGARGYLVTYRLTDPLYVLDLSNPADPFIAGALEVSGYSDYLFPLSENLLLGVGKEAVEERSGGDGRFAWYQGVKLSLIDLTDPANPREAAKSVIGRRGTDATVLRDHHGIAIVQNGSSTRVSLPVSLHETAPQGANGAANTYFQYTRTELQKFDIDTARRTLKAKVPLPSILGAQRDISRDRSLLWGEQVHYYQNGVWTSGLW